MQNLKAWIENGDIFTNTNLDTSKENEDMAVAILATLFDFVDESVLDTKADISNETIDLNFEFSEELYISEDISSWSVEKQTLLVVAIEVILSDLEMFKNS